MRQAVCCPAAANGANEESVRLFLNGKIKFTDIAVLNRAAMEACRKWRITPWMMFCRPIARPEIM